MEIINRITSYGIASDLVYPALYKYKRICKIDKAYVKEMLQIYFNVSRIENKYGVQLPNGQIWYQHDGSTWLIEELY